MQLSSIKGAVQFIRLHMLLFFGFHLDCALEYCCINICCFNFNHFFRKRKDVKDILLCTNSGLNIKRFARLLIFSFLIVFAMVPLSLYYFVSQAEVLKNPFHWDQVHNEEWNVIYFMILDFSHFMTDWSTVFFLFLLLLYLDWVQMHLTCINPCFIKCNRCTKRPTSRIPKSKPSNIWSHKLKLIPINHNSVIPHRSLIPQQCVTLKTSLAMLCIRLSRRKILVSDLRNNSSLRLQHCERRRSPQRITIDYQRY